MANINTRDGALRSFNSAVKGGKNAMRAVAFLFGDMLNAQKQGNNPDFTCLKKMFLACEQGDKYQTNLKIVTKAVFGAKTKIIIKKDGTVTIKDFHKLNSVSVTKILGLAKDEVSFVGPKLAEAFNTGNAPKPRSAEMRIDDVVTELLKIERLPDFAGDILEAVEKKYKERKNITDDKQEPQQEPKAPKAIKQEPKANKQLEAVN